MSTFSRNLNHHWKCREQKENFQKILVIICWNFTIFEYKSDSPQAKGNLISSIANLVYGLPNELPNNLRDLGSQEIRKYQKNLKFGWTHSIVSILPSRTQTLRIAVKKHAITDTKFFISCLVLLDYSILFQIFYPRLQLIFKYKSPQSSSAIYTD